MVEMVGVVVLLIGLAFFIVPRFQAAFGGSLVVCALLLLSTLTERS
jgi:hypothetical protein